MAARDVAQALKTFASAARGVAATTEDLAARNAMLDCAADVLDKSANLIEETKRAIVKPGDAESQQRLAQVRYRGGGSVMSESDVFTHKYYFSLPYLHFNETYTSRHFRTAKIK